MSPTTTSALHPDTAAVHAGRDDLTDLGVHALPLDLSSTSPLVDVERGGDSYEAMAHGGRPDGAGGHVYARLWNPTVARFEDALAALEHAEAAVAFSSGMAALTAVLLGRTREAGSRHVVAVRPLYGGSDVLLDGDLLGLDVTFCEPDQVAHAVRPDTAVVLLETPANPTLRTVEVRDVAAAAGDVPLLVDNTFATPVLQNPLDHGAALVLHSATKYLAGHGDVVGGVVACDERLAAELRRVRVLTGSVLHPLAAYLAHRGLATLPVRVRAQQATATDLARRLADHPAVAEVWFPGLSAPLPMSLRGPGAMLTARLHGGGPAAAALLDRLRLFTHAVSLGSVDSLVQHPASLTHRAVAPEARPGADVVRFSVGLEDAADLWADLTTALDGVAPRAAVSEEGLPAA